MRYLISLILIAGFVGSVAAQTCSGSISNTTPSSRFEVGGDGTARDLATDLIWMRCSLGQTWNGSGCDGNASYFTWTDALTTSSSYSFAGHDDWRLPNIKELTSIAEEACFDPAINTEIFPGTVSGRFWSSSPNSGNSSYARHAHFYHGNGGVYDKENTGHVRLVRDNQ